MSNKIKKYNIYIYIWKIVKMTFMIREYLGYYLIDSPSLERFKDQLDKSKVKTVYNEQY